MPTDASATGRSARLASVDPILDYELTLTNLNGLYLAHHGLYRLSRRDPEPLERVHEALAEIPPEEVERITREIDREPTVRDALAQARISARDFYLTQHTLVNAVAVLAARAAGRVDNLPAVSERNLDFVRRNPQQVHRVMTERRPRGA